jgi:hypothetical protein
MTSLAAVLAPAAIVGVTWLLSRASADRRWRAALDRYAEREQVKQPKTLTQNSAREAVLHRISHNPLRPR